MKISRRVSLNMTEALATSNNQYFANVGIRMGFAKVRSYANLFGLGERATLNVDREQPGTLTATSPSFGGVGMMSSFGEGIELTAMQLAALMSTIANGGTLYHLQYPRSPFEGTTMEPRIKRQLAIGSWIPDLKPGMMGAVAFGTARRAGYSADEPILGQNRHLYRPRHADSPGLVWLIQRCGRAQAGGSGAAYGWLPCFGLRGIGGGRRRLPKAERDTIFRR